MIQSNGLLEFGLVELEARLSMFRCSTDSCQKWQALIPAQAQEDFSDGIYRALLEQFQHSEQISAVLSHFSTHNALNEYIHLLFNQTFDQTYIDRLAKHALDLTNQQCNLSTYSMIGFELHRQVLTRFGQFTDDKSTLDALSKRLQFDMMLVTDFIHHKELEDVKRYCCLMEIKDSLTDLYTYETFIEELDRMVAQCQRNHSSVLVLKANVKDLNGINQRYGYEFGNQVLQTFAAVSQDLIRKSDVVARGKDDNFYLALLDTDQQEASSICQRICEHVEQRSELPVTLCFGGSSYVQDQPTSIDKLITSVDKHLLLAQNRSKVTNQHEFSVFFGAQDNVIHLVK